MVVDCHTHLGADAGYAEASEHLTAVEAVDACIVLASSDGPSEEVNKKLADYVEKHKDKMVGFAVVEPTADGIERGDLKAIRDKLDLKGLVLYCSGHGFHPAHSNAMRLYESAADLGLPVFFHNGDASAKAGAVLEYAQPYLLDEVARAFPKLRIVVGNMGVPFVEQTFSLIGKHENVYGDLTVRPTNVWQLYNTVVGAYERGAMDKLVFGSGFPCGKATECIETLLGFNMLLSDTNLPTVPRDSIRRIIERDTFELLGINDWAGKDKVSDNREHGERTVE